MTNGFHHHANWNSSLRKVIGLNSVRDPATGFTCLHHTALNGHLQCATLILAHGAKPNAVDYKGSSPLHLAAWAGNLDLVRLLLSHHQHQQQQQQHSADGQPPEVVDVNLCNNDNQSALSLAAQFGHSPVVAALLAAGANPHLRNSQLDSPLDLACLNGRLETTDLLLRGSPELVAELRQPRALLSPSSCQWAPPACDQSLESRAGQQSPAGRRQSGGWSSLLRGRRDSASSSPARHAHPRRATLTEGAPGVWSLDEECWQAPSRRLSEQLAPAGERRLLDHSPLHYAVRRGHLNIVSLLLGRYQANLLQVTSLGGVLHELAMNNCNPRQQTSDMLRLLFEHLAARIEEQANGNRIVDGQTLSNEPSHLLNKFLALTNCQGQNVFQLLAELNNRSAQELRRSIYELTDQIKHKILPQQTVARHQLGKTLTRHHQPTSSASQEQASDTRCDHIATLRRSQANAFRLMGAEIESQTIDRRLAAQNRDHYRDNQDHSQSFDQPAPLVMTRSFSSLHYPQEGESTLGAISDFRSMEEHGAAAQEQELVRRMHGRHSRSRDFASVLAEAYERQRTTVAGGEQAPDQLLVRSQTDCSQLMGRQQQQHQQQPSPTKSSSYSAAWQAANQNKNQTLGRKGINRHYHVYEHEFYPPRLVQQQQSHSQRPPQSVAIVPPLARNVNHETGPLRSSTRSNASSNCSARSAPRAHPPASLSSFGSSGGALKQANSRLSLNISQQQAGEMAHGQPLQSIDRFVMRHSRQATFGPTTSQQMDQEDLTDFRSASVDQHRDHGPRQSVDGKGSQSIDSHSLESGLRDLTERQTLLDDFNKMIGRELMARDHRQIFPLDQIESRGSVLTGVMLDMDKHGDRLTVSGTQVTVSPQPSAHSQGTQTNSSDVSPAPARRLLVQDSPPPPKPPRLSLLNRSNSSMQSGSTKITSSRPVIYDLPGGAAKESSPSSSAIISQRPRLTHRSQTIALDERKPALDEPASGSTEPPKTRPPPLPLQAQTTSPLHMAPVVDPDSGICTSNSPASMSHDSEPNEQVDQQQAQVSSSNQNRTRKMSSGLEDPPPSPKTAQLCIEQVLLPLTQTNTNGEFIDWLTSPADGDGRQSTESGYENCSRLPAAKLIGLRSQLSSPVGDRKPAPMISLLARPSPSASPSIGGSSSANQTTSYGATSEEQEDCDYATQSVSCSANSGSSQSSCQEASTTSGSEPHSDDDHDEQLDAGFSSGRKKEILLKVVVDESEQEINGDDDVFYMNPLELKKVAVKRAQTDAETLTDEELCAAIDKGSGYIRFTLRKRRNENGANQEASQSQGAELEKENEPFEQIEIHEQDHKEHSKAKKSKLIAPSHSLGQEVNSSQLRANEPNKSVLLHDDNNNLEISGSRTRQSTSKLEQWFSAKLIGLAEYANRFQAQGYDDIRFLNHPSLMNDQLLESMAIRDPTHRTLILNSIANHLEPVNFEALLVGSSEEKLDLSALSLPGGLLSISDIERFHHQVANSWPQGHRLRLEAALQFLADRRRSSLAASKDEIVSSPSTSSSTSKDSIKSIIMISRPTERDKELESELEPRPMRESQAYGSPKEPGDSTELKGPAIESLSKERISPQINRSPSPKNRNPRTGSGSPSVISASNSSVSEVARKLEQSCGSTMDGRTPIGMATHDFRANLKPVAAARRVNNKPTDWIADSPPTIHQFPKQPTGIRSMANEEQQQSPRRAFVPVKSICWPPQQKSEDSHEPISKENEIPEIQTIGKISATRSLFQRKLDQQDHCYGDQNLAKCKGRGTRVSNQKSMEKNSSQEDGSKSNNNSLVSKIGGQQFGFAPGMKPAPPKKPAKLALTKRPVNHQE